MKINQKGFSAFEGILLLIILALIGGIGWYVLSQNKDSKNTTTNTQTTQPTGNTTEQSQSDDIVICNVNPSAESGGGIKVAFYGYVKGDEYTKVWVEYGSSADKLVQKTAEFENGPDTCDEFLAHMPADGLAAGKYFYRVAATTQSGTTVHSKTDSFTKE